ncbi:tetratricopeptide repeat protein [Streptomyces sp. NPDC048643]|uniref:tetratricopeptide repeat protein n=1 Tax=Streptomyces sp. NPDC048643 TaxID=3155637 RepID=UPI00341CF451
MSRLSRDQQREPQRQYPAAGAGGRPATGETPIEVRVPATPAASASGDGASAVATADGRPIVAKQGEPVQAAILRHLHRLALAVGHPVLASVHDERIGFVVPLQVSVDGSSRYTGEPVRTPARPEGTPPRPEGASPAPRTAPAPPPVPASEPAPASAPASASAPAPARVSEPAEPIQPAETVKPVTSAPSTVVLRKTRPQPYFEHEAEPESLPLPGGGVTQVLRSAPEPAPAPLGRFGPAPVMDPVVEPPSAPAPKPSAPAMEALSLLAPEREPEPKPAPVRGFDAVAEAVLAPNPDASDPGQGGTTAFSAEPVARINEAVRMGRIDEAATTAERTVAAAAQALGEEHPEVLKLRELTAYIAYLAGDALRAFHLSLDLARVRRRQRDAEGAYGNVQSAATAWRAVRDPLQGLHLGRDLIGVWTELAADGGPAADDIGQLDSARTRMGRLAERARAL